MYSRRLLPLLLLIVSILIWIAAYQVPAQMILHLGGDVATLRRFDEDAFFHAINGSEPADRDVCREDANRLCWWWELLAPGERPYRWTSSDTWMTLPGLGAGPYVVTLTARGQPTPEPTPSHWQVGNLAVTVNLPRDQIRRYHVLSPSSPDGDLHIALRTTPFPAPNDPRELGFVLYELRVAQADTGSHAPAWPHIGWLSLMIAAAYATARILSVTPRVSSAFALGLSLAAALSLVLIRPTLTLFTPILAGISAVATLIALIGWAATRSRPTPFARHVLALTLLALALRTAGLLHPQALYSDSAFHANKLYALTLGQVFQSAGLPREAGGGEAPYPTGAYLLLLPAQLLLPSSARVELMQVGTALLDSLLLPMIALLIAHAGLGARAALFAAACYLLPTPALEALSIGELANISGQTIGLSFIALIAYGSLNQPTPQRGLLALALLTAGLLAHSGVTLSLGAFTAAIWLLTLVRYLQHAFLSRRRENPNGVQRPILYLSSIAAGALICAIVIYYSAPIYIESIMGRVGGSATEVSTRHGSDPLTIVVQTLAGIFGFVPPSARFLPPLIGMLAASGLGLLWTQRQTQPQATTLRLTLTASWIGIFFTQALLLIADQGVRWSLFLYPTLCMSAGPFLASLTRRGWAGRAFALSAFSATFTYGLYIWIVQVRDYFHL